MTFQNTLSVVSDITCPLLYLPSVLPSVPPIIPLSPMCSPIIPLYTTCVLLLPFP